MNNSVPSDYRRSHRYEMKVFLPDSYSRVLEIGCGEGNFKENLAPGVEYWGVEPDPSSAEEALQKGTILCGFYFDIEENLPNNYFDLIICNDVIEHIEDTEKLLESIHLKMRDGGSLVASIPNVRYVWNLKELLVDKDWKYKESGILDRTHLRFFTKNSILRMFGSERYQVELFSGVRSILWRTTALKKIAAFILYIVPLSFFGFDSQYMQFGMRIRIDK